MNLPNRTTFQQMPRMILSDRNGFAMACAINAALEPFLQSAALADTMLSDVEQSPEWLLDEMAHEKSLSWYDFSAPIEMKREWIRTADEIAREIGTVACVKRLVRIASSECTVLEAREYGGSGFGFRVIVPEGISSETTARIFSAISAAAPVRCIFDGLYQYGDESITLTDEEARYIYDYPRTGAAISGASEL